ncbi:MAG TPA: DUF2023 family protein [Spirochaetota bacterium]|nr:DUF2023 family protein [Spirochaetota bacterium]HPJ33406.1 DUF2023 family protein [Spirochaetota bacterium]
MKILVHHIYEYRKGLRNLVLHTIGSEYRKEAERKLSANKIDFVIQEVDEKKINIFFGAPECVEIIRNFGPKKLSRFTDEEDFILGIMLGYCRLEQCRRFLKRKDRKENAA